jgi:UDP:flavonoid glycosyltransferase YjiC (YdhE family)
MLAVYIGCFGSGLGHATRMLWVAERLKERGDAVEFSSSGEAACLIRGHGYSCNDLPLADVRYSEEGAFSLRETMAASPMILARSCWQVQREVTNMKQFGPRVVLSDSSLSTVLAARILGLPVFAVLNQLSLTSSYGATGAPSRLLSTGITASMSKLWELDNEILLPDLPPPYTISERNLWGSNVHNTRYIGFLSAPDRGAPDAVTSSFVTDPRLKVFWQVSGPPKTRGPFLKKALDLAKTLSNRFVFVVAAGDPSGNTVAEEIPGGWCYGWCRIPELYFATCDAVVSRAGHGTIGQAILSSKPSLLVPIPGQPEQEGNGLKAERLGVSIMLNQDELNVERTLDSLHLLMGTGSVAMAAQLGKYASTFNAAEDLVETLTSAAA